MLAQSSYSKGGRGGAEVSEPLVCCVMLTRDRAAMAARAVAAFRAQTYERKRLYMYDTGDVPCTDVLPDGYPDFGIIYHRGNDRTVSIGKLRQYANWWGARPSSTSGADVDIFVHWDDDDYSHPNRIAEQVALLQASGADCVGYNEVLFWREVGVGRDQAGNSRGCEMCRTIPCSCDGQAWIYSNRNPQYATGASLCYWRRTWERHPFKDVNVGEDNAFLQSIRDAGGKIVTRSTFASSDEEDAPSPRLIQSIHSSNTAARIDETSQQWRRATGFDSYCRERMKL